MIITRYAPSPTGDPHIGNIRTALFAYLFARSNNGKFFLRIEDTDRERFQEGSVETIINSLKWLGIEPSNLDKIPYQSERLENYRKHAYDLVKAGHAYICTCTKERLAEQRLQQEKEGKPPMYDGRCREEKCEIGNSAEFFKDMMQNGYVIRMKMPKNKKIGFDDMIRGHIEFDSNLIDDQVIIKSDGFPTYHFAHVIDDHEMGTTHVIRGEEWLSSTPKHLILFEMFSWEPPKYAHLSLILGPDKKKLSKRHGAMSVLEYKKAGYLPEAIVNFIAFLGWNPKNEQEEFLLSDLEREFKIENVNKSPAVFDFEKLNTINERYLIERIESNPASIVTLLSEFGVPDVKAGELALLSRGGYKTVVEMAEEIQNLRKIPDYKAEILVFKKSTKEASKRGLEVSDLILNEIEEDAWQAQELQMKLGLAITRENLTNGDLFWPVRVALSGREKSPSPVELLIALGKAESLKRIKNALSKLV